MCLKLEPINFASYCESFLIDPVRGAQIFFLDKHEQYTYQGLIRSALCRAQYFTDSPHNFFALKIDSSYKLMTHLLGAIFAQKNILIISSKEPALSIAKYQENLPFTQILTDSDIEYAYNGFHIPDVQISSSKAAFFILSSGSSGPAKGIPLTLKNVFYSSKSVIDFFHMKTSDTSFSNLPHHHIGGLMIFWRAFFSGGKVTTDENDEYQFLSLVPLQLQRSLADSEKIKKLQKCRGVLIGGAPLLEQLKKQAHNNNIPIFETYGMSETCSLVMLNGRPLNGQSIKLDSEGYFLIKGQTLSHSVPVDSEGFYHTKDIGFQNSDGTYSYKHRGDLLFKSAGELVNPLALEARTKELPWISEALVVPVNHHEWTKAGVLIYKTNDETKTGYDIKEYLKDFFHPHLIPKYYIEAPKDLIAEGIKPKRFEISRFAQEYYFKGLFHYLYIPNPSSKRLIVFFHGFMEDHADMIPLMDNHIESSFLFIDLPGHGRTTANNFKSRASIFAELTSLINFYHVENSLILYGYSMGGRVALELTLMGLRPNKLILESSHFGLPTSEEKSTRLESDKKLFADSNLDLTAFFDNWYKNPIFGKYNQSSQYIIDVQKKIYHNPKEWQTALDFFSPGAFPFEISNVIELLSMQNIVGIVGTEDAKYKKHFEELSLKLPLLKLNEIKECGHNPHKTHLHEVKKILLANL